MVKKSQNPLFVPMVVAIGVLTVFVSGFWFSSSNSRNSGNIMMPFNFSSFDFPPTLVINLDKRTDRMEEIHEEFKEWPVPVERVSATQLKPGWKGCSASHLKCVQVAKDRGYPWVLILEDDCVLKPDAARRLTALLPFLWKNRDRWDLFNGGVTSLKHHVRISKRPDIHEVYAYAANFYIVHQSVYEPLLQGHPTDPAKFKDPIDVYYPDHFRMWTTVPYLAGQRPGKSNIEKGEQDYTKYFAAAEQKLMKSE